MAAPQLTKQQSMVLAWLAQGMTHREIAEAAGIAERTVRNYAAGAYVRLGVRNRVEAFAILGWLIRPAVPVNFKQRPKGGTA